MEKRPPHKLVSYRLPVAIAAISLTTALLAVVFIPCPTDAQYIIFRGIFSLGMGGAAASIPGFFTFNYRPYIMSGGGLGVFAFVYIFTPKLLNTYHRCETLSDPFAVTVYVHGERGKNDLVLKGQGQVVMDPEGDRRIRKINETGEAYFTGIPPKFHYTPIRLGILPEHDVVYEAADTHAIKIGDTKALYLKVKTVGLDRVVGKIRDANNLPLRDVTVSVQGIRTRTNELGEFTLLIGKDKQQPQQKLTAFKQGYRVYDTDIYPATKQAVEIVMKKL